MNSAITNTINDIIAANADNDVAAYNAAAAALVQQFTAWGELASLRRAATRLANRHAGSRFQAATQFGIAAARLSVALDGNSAPFWAQ